VKLLLDACVWGRAAEQLRAAGHDVVWVGDWADDPGDEAILLFAAAEERTCVTIDKDFGELAVRQSQPHHGIVRIVGFSARQHADVCIAAISAHGDELAAGAIVTAEPGRLRVRPPEK
jgi:predicted nuclease of predicted toxin-antitoxin system